MGQIVIGPRPQLKSESDEEYYNYIHGEYYQYLLAGAADAKASMKEMLIAVIVAALIVGIILLVVK